MTSLQDPGRRENARTVRFHVFERRRGEKFEQVETPAQGSSAIGVIELCDQTRGYNVLCHDVEDSLRDALGQAEQLAPQLAAVCIASCHENCFVFGADVATEVAIRSSRDGCALSLRVKALFCRLAALPCPTVAVIRGGCLGGGLELALHCAFRVADEHGKTRIGLPEVKLGVIPGGGGCAILPHIVGYATAADLLASGRSLNARGAKATGLVDAIVPCARFIDSHPPAWLSAVFDLVHTRAACIPNAARMFDPAGAVRRGCAIAEVVENAAAVRGSNCATNAPLLARVANASPIARAVRAYACAAVAKKVGTRYNAPFEALRVAFWSLSQPALAYADESSTFGMTVVTPEAKALSGLFLSGQVLKRAWRGVCAVPAMESLRKRVADGEAVHVCVVGAGYMGSGIALHMLQRGLRVTLVDTSPAALDKFMRNANAKRHLVTACMSLRDVDWVSVEIVLESVTEDIALKRALFAELKEHATADTVLLSNTSSIPLHELAEGGRIVGFHCFHPERNRTPVVEIPVPGLPLGAEIVPAQSSNPDHVSCAASLALRLGKTPVLVRGDAKAFVANRLLATYLVASTALACASTLPLAEHTLRILEALQPAKKQSPLWISGVALLHGATQRARQWEREPRSHAHARLRRSSELAAAGDARVACPSPPSPAPGFPNAITRVERSCSAFGFVVGPFTALDRVGLATASKVATLAAQALPHASTFTKEIEHVLTDIYAHGIRGGHKNPGILLCPRRAARANPRAVDHLQRLADALGGAVDPLRVDQGYIIASAIAAEAARCVDAGLCPQEACDVLSVLAVGFPPFWGGALAFARGEGPGNVRSALRTVSCKHSWLKGVFACPASIARHTAAMYPDRAPAAHLPRESGEQMLHAARAQPSVVAALVWAGAYASALCGIVTAAVVAWRRAQPVV